MNEENIENYPLGRYQVSRTGSSDLDYFWNLIDTYTSLQFDLGEYPELSDVNF